MISIAPQARRLPVPEPEPAGYDQVLQAVKLLFDRAFARIAALEERRAAANGRDGVGITDVTVDGAGELIVVFSDGFVKNCGRVRGADAPAAPAPQQLVIERDGDGRIVRGRLS